MISQESPSGGFCFISLFAVDCLVLRDLLFLFAALICEILGTIGGFGSSVFFVPAATWFFSFQTVLAITGILHIFSNLSKLILFGSHIDYKLLLRYGVPSILFVLLGAWLSSLVSFELAQVTLSIFLISFSLLLLFFPYLKLPANNSNAIISGSLSGFIAGFNGTGGVIRGMSMVAFNLEKNVFVASSAAIDLGVDMSRSAVYLGNGYMPASAMYLIPFLLVISFLGSWIGKILLARIPQDKFRKVVLLLVLGIGISLLISEWHHLD